MDQYMLGRVRQYQQFMYVAGEAEHKLVATVTATEEAGTTGVNCRILAIHHAGNSAQVKVDDVIVCAPEEITRLVDNPTDPVKPGRFEATLSSSSLSRVPYPAILGCMLLQNSGRLFGGVPEEFHTENIQVPIYNIGELVGFITYLRQGNTVKVIINDVPNSQGNVLTVTAGMLRH